MVYKFFDKKTSGGALMGADKSDIKTEIMSSQQLAKECYPS